MRGTPDITSIGIFWYVHLRVSGIGFWHLRIRWQVGVIGSSCSVVELRERVQQQHHISTIFGFEQLFFSSRWIICRRIYSWLGTTMWDMRLLWVELPDATNRLQGSVVRSSVQDHGRGDVVRRYTWSSSRVHWFISKWGDYSGGIEKKKKKWVGGRNVLDFSLEDHNWPAFIQCRAPNWLGFSVRIEIDLFFMCVIEMNLILM